MRQRSEHEEAVKEFFDRMKKECPEKYAEVCKENPIVTRAKLYSIFKKEIPSGLVGLEPCRISPSEANKASVDSSFYDD